MSRGWDAKKGNGKQQPQIIADERRYGAEAFFLNFADLQLLQWLYLRTSA